MQSFTSAMADSLLRPLGSTQRPLASSSPRCAPTPSPWPSRSRHHTLSYPQAIATSLAPRHRPAGQALVPARPAAATARAPAPPAGPGTPDDAAPLDAHDSVLAAELGGRGHLELAAAADASLQVHMVQWYPGHIARAERQLKAQLSMVDVVLEVRDARCPVASHHPQVATWVGVKPRLLLLNRADQVAAADLAAWRAHYAGEGVPVIYTDGRSGDGVKAVKKELLKVAAALNAKRAKRGLQPRPVRACVIGFPNIGKSALINRLINRRAVASAPKPGVTRDLRWVRLGGELDLLDAPGVIPASFRDQVAAQRLAVCNDIGEAAYIASAVAAGLVLRVKQLAAAEEAEAAAWEAKRQQQRQQQQAQQAQQAQAAADAQPQREEGQAEPRGPEVEGKGAPRRGRREGPGGAGKQGGGGPPPRVMPGVLDAMRRRYGVDPLTVGSAEDWVAALAAAQYGGCVERAGTRLLVDYRNGHLGPFALERPADLERRKRREAELTAAALRREQRGDGEEGEEEEDRAAQGGAAGADAAAPAGPASGWPAAPAAGGAFGGGYGAGGEVNSRWVEEAEAAAAAQDRARAAAAAAGGVRTEGDTEASLLQR